MRVKADTGGTGQPPSSWTIQDHRALTRSGAPNVPRLIPDRCQLQAGGGVAVWPGGCGSRGATCPSLRGRRAAVSPRWASVCAEHGHTSPHHEHRPKSSQVQCLSRIRRASRHNNVSMTSTGSVRSVTTTFDTPKPVARLPMIDLEQPLPAKLEIRASSPRTSCATAPERRQTRAPSPACRAANVRFQP
jgi:hypothetical protein